MNKDQVRYELQKMMPGIPLADKEEIVEEVMEAVNTYGMLRLMTI